MEKSEVYRFSLLGPGRLLFGPLMMVFGVGLLLTEKAQMAHRVANGGQIFGSLFNVVLWLGFAAVGLLCLIWGVWMLQSDRRTWIENGELHTARGIVPMFHRRYAKREIERFEVSKQPVTVVFGNRSTSMGERYQVAMWLKRLGGKSRMMIVANCGSEAEALKVKARLSA